MWKYIAVCFLLWPIVAYAFDDAPLTWTQVDPANVTGFNLYSSDAATGAFAKESVVLDADDRSVTVPMKFEHTFYKLKSFNSAGESLLFSNMVDKVSTPQLTFVKTVVDGQGRTWGIVGVVPYDIYLNNVKLSGKAGDLRVRDGIAEVKGIDPVTLVMDGSWWTWSGTAWTKTVTDPPVVIPPVVIPPVVVPPVEPNNLIISGQTLDTITIVASAGKCTSLRTLTPTKFKRVVTCVH